MSTDTAANSATVDEISNRLEFTRNLNHVINKMHATTNIDEIMLDVSKDICVLFNADRLTIYVVAADKSSLISKVKTGLNSFKDLKLPISEQSVSGYAAVHKRLINIRDVYDEQELLAYSPYLRILQEVDRRTGYRTRQMLVGPILDSNGALVGVIQVINHKSGVPFPAMFEEGLCELAQNMAVALLQRQQNPPAKTKYDHLMADSILSAAEFELATRTARRKGIDIEEVLSFEFHVSSDSLGKALSTYFGVPYEPYKENRIRPSELLKNLKQQYVQSSNWIPLEENQHDLVILTTDPEQIHASRVVNNIFPKCRLIYKVCSHKEFKQTLDQFYGGEQYADDEAITISNEARAFVFERDGFACQTCGAIAGESHPFDLTQKTILYMVHIIDKNVGGIDNPANLRLICSVCHWGESNTALHRPNLLQLLIQVSHATSYYQLEFLRRMFNRFFR